MTFRPDALDLHFASERRKHLALISLFAGFASHANHVLGALKEMQPSDWYALQFSRDKLCDVTMQLGEHLVKLSNSLTGPVEPPAAAEVVSTSSAPVALPATADPYGVVDADAPVLLEISDILSAEAQRALKEAV